MVAAVGEPRPRSRLAEPPLFRSDAVGSVGASLLATCHARSREQARSHIPITASERYSDQLSLIVVSINQVGRQVPLPAMTVVET